MENSIIMKAVKELQGWGHSEGLFSIIQEVNEATRMLAVTLQYANEGLEWLAREGSADDTRISGARESLNGILEILPDAHGLDNIMFQFQMVNKLLTAIAIDQLTKEKKKCVKDGATVA